MNSDVLDKYKAGFQECTREVSILQDHNSLQTKHFFKFIKLSRPYDFQNHKTINNFLSQVTRFLDTPELHLCGDSSKCMKNQPNGTIKTSNSNSVFIEPAVKQRLLRHLNSCSSEIDLDFSKSESLQDNPSVIKCH